MWYWACPNDVINRLALTFCYNCPKLVHWWRHNIELHQPKFTVSKYFTVNYETNLRRLRIQPYRLTVFSLNSKSSFRLMSKHQNQNNHNGQSEERKIYLKSQWELLRSEANQTAWSAGKRVVIGLVLHLIGWKSCAILSGPITNRSKAKTTKLQITSNSQMKTALKWCN